MFLKQIRSNVYKMIVRLQLVIQNYLMKHLEIFCKQREGNSETFNTSWRIYQESLTIQRQKRFRKSDLQISQKQKRRRQAAQLRKTRQEEALHDPEGVTYEAGGF